MAVFRRRSSGPIHFFLLFQVDIVFNSKTKIAYDLAQSVCYRLFFDEQPVDYFTVLTQRHLLKPFQGNPAAIEKLESSAKFPFLRYVRIAASLVMVHISDNTSLSFCACVELVDRMPQLCFSPNFAFASCCV